MSESPSNQTINRKTVIFVEAHIPILEVVQPEAKNVIIAKRQDILKNAVTQNLENKEKSQEFGQNKPKSKTTQNTNTKQKSSAYSIDVKYDSDSD